MCSGDSSIRFAFWNAHSVDNKRADIEYLLHDRELDVLCITETWLDEDVAFEFNGYLTYRCDRPGGGGGGSAILVRESLSILPLFMDGPWGDRLDAVAIRLSTVLGSLAVISLYAPPESCVDAGMWSSLIWRSLGCDLLFFCGDFNAHSPLWGARCSNFQGRELCSAVLDHGLTPLNDSLPTFLAATGRSGGNLDLVFFTSSRVGVASA